MSNIFVIHYKQHSGILIALSWACVCEISGDPKFNEQFILMSEIVLVVSYSYINDSLLNST